MKKIGWTQISSKRYGGIIWGERTQEVLSKEFDLELIDMEAKYFKKVRYLKIPESFVYLLKLKGQKDLWIRDFYSTLTLLKRRTKGKNLAFIFHVDFSRLPLVSIIPFFLLEKLLFYRQLKRFDAIIVVSEYWKNYFLKRGFSNVYKIYAGFNLADFDIKDEEVLDFKKKYNLEGKPIIYIGNCQKAKGVVESYKNLKDLDVHLVTSSRRQVKIPALNLDLEYRDYLKLLKASSIAVTMSKLKEGWCMTTHEAMLLNTPVIGSGIAGMEELLKGGNQIVCKDFRNLKEKVEYLLNHPEAREKMGKDGHNFTKTFTLERFEKEWLNLIKKIL